MKLPLLLYFLSTVIITTSSILSAAIPLDGQQQSSTSISSHRYTFEFTGPEDADIQSQKFIDFIKKEYPNAKVSTSRVTNHDLLKSMTISVEQYDSTHSTTNQKRDQPKEQSQVDNRQLMNKIYQKAANVGLVNKMYRVHTFRRPNILTTMVNAIPQDEHDALLMSTDPQTQVDRVHRELSNTGQGIIVGVIDSGVDYMHPALGGGFGPGFKVRYGRDLVGDDYNSDRGIEPIPDPDPMDSCDPKTGSVGHGTHVSGIIAGKSENFTGVAPDAILGMWRVFGCSGNADDDVVVEAMLDAYDTGVDVISMSLSDAMGWSESLTGVVAERITAKGVPVVAAASNDGEYGAFTVGTPSAGKGVYSIASFDNNYNLVTVFEVTSSSSNDKKYYRYNVDNINVTKKLPDGEVVAGDLHLGSNVDACQSDTIPDNLQGKIALIQRGTCNFTDKANNLAKKGAIGAIVYNTKDENLIPAIEGATIPMIGVPQDTGRALIDDMKQGPLRVTFFERPKARPEPSGNTVSSFSSVGPAYELDVRPNLAGVGGNVYSTLPRQFGGWGLMSGTSMATPGVAGAVALVLKAWQHNDGQKPSPQFMLEQFQNYAYKAPNKNGQDNVDSPNRQGAGLIQVYDTIQEAVHISPATISFNDTEHLQKTQTITITNFGAIPASYQILNNVSVSIVPYNTSKGYNFSEPVGYGTDAAQLEFSQTTVMLDPGAHADIQVTVIPPETDPKEHILYGGYIQFKNDNQGRDLTVPYIGVVGNQRELPIYGRGTPDLTNSTNITHYPAYETNDIFVFDRSQSIMTKKELKNVPIFMLTLDNPTRVLSTPLYNEQNEIIGYAAFKNDTINFARATSSTPAQFIWWGGDYTPAQTTTTETDKKPTTLVSMVGSALDTLLPLSNYDDNPSTISAAPGNYRIGLNALKWFGNPENPEDWETWISGIIQVR